MKKGHWLAGVCVVVVFALSFCLAGTGHAVPLYFTNQTAFNLAAGGGLNFESFETQLVNAAQPSFTFTGFTVSETNGINAITDVLTNSSFSTTPVTDGKNAIWYDDNGDSISTFFSFTGPVNAFGLDITTDTISSVTIGGDIGFVLNLAANTPQFFGVIDSGSAGFGSISFNASGGPLVGFDAVSYGSVSVPEPATFLLFGAGLAGVGLLRRKRRI